MIHKTIYIFAAILLFFVGLPQFSLQGSTKYVAPTPHFHHQEGDPQILAGIHLKIAEGWHAYWKNSGGIGYPPTVEWELPQGFSAEPMQWPAPERFESPLGYSFGYTGDLWLINEIIPSPTWDGSPLEVKAKVKWLVCSESTCLPGEKEVSFRLAKGGVSTPLQEAHQKMPEDISSLNNQNIEGGVVLHLPDPQAKEAYFYPAEHEVVSYEQQLDQGHLTLRWHEGKDIPVTLLGTLVTLNQQGEQKSWNVTLPLSSSDSISSGEESGFYQQILITLGLAFLGGMILNLMPCVLPVISLKIFSFCKMAGENRKAIFYHGLLFAGGVLISFWILAGALILLKTYGQSVGWGFQLQEPIFVASLAAVIFLFGLSLFGVFEVGTIFASWAGQKQSDTMQKSNSAWGSFFSGILATAVATPCTGPFLGSAVGFALTLSPIWAMMIFTSLGLGMSAPYLILSAFPGLLRFIPKPGGWMLTFKEILGFCMMATTVWLAWVFAALTDNSALFVLISAFLFLSLGAWILGKWGAPRRRKKVRLIGLGLGCMIILLAGYMIVKASSSEAPIVVNNEVAMLDPGEIHVYQGKWEPYNPHRLQQLQKEGTPVFIDFTAKWCLICQTNHLVLSEGSVDEKFVELGVVKMKGDWTRRDPVITEALEKFGRSGVPLYLLYDGKGHVEILPQVLTPDIVITALENMKSHD